MIAVLKRYPVTASYFTLTIAIGIATGFAGGPSRDARLAVGTGFDQFLLAGRWWTPLSAGFFSNGWGELLVALVAIVVCVGAAERFMGSVRTLVAMLSTALVGTLVGVAVQAFGIARGELWSSDVRQFAVVDPFTFVVGALMASSAFYGPLWRRRIRVLTLAACLVLLLYSGQPSDLYRLIAALAGWLLGNWYRPSPTAGHWLRSTHHEVRILLSVVVAMTAVGPVITLLSGGRFGLLGPLGLLMSNSAPVAPSVIDQCQVIDITRACLRELTLVRVNSFGPIIVTLMPLLTLLVVAFGLARGRRVAAWLGISLNVALAGLGTYYYGILPVTTRLALGPSQVSYQWEATLSLVASILLPLAIAGLIFRNLSHFTIRAPAGRVRTYLAAVVVSFVGLSALYLGASWFERAHFHPAVQLSDLCANLPERFIPVGYLRLQALQFLPTDAWSRVLYNWIGPAFWVVVIVGALYTYFNSGSRNHAEGLPKVQALRWAGGGGALGGWATWTGNSYWFSADGRASVAYRVINGVAITTSEPIGEMDAAFAAVAEFSRFCDDRGWVPVFYAIHEPFLPTIAEMGWHTVVVGEETVIRPGTWDTRGSRWQDIRSSINRADRLGVTAHWTSFAGLRPDQAEQVRALSEQWVADQGLPEMGFTLGGFDELNDPDVRLMIAVGEEGAILGVTSWLPSYRDGRVIGWTLDVMRRAPHSMNGVMEFLIAKSAEQFRATGAQFMSLSTAPLAPSVIGADDSVAARVLRRISSALEPVYGFRSLFLFKSKFQPELHPIMMAYPDPLALPTIALALARAYLPGLSVRQSIRFVRGLR